LVVAPTPGTANDAPIALHDSVANTRSKWPPRPDHVGRVERSVPPPPPPKPSRVVPTIVALALLSALAVGAGVQRGWFETDADKLEGAFAQDGIEPGRYEDAAAFAERLGARVSGLEPDALQGLLEGLRRSGAPRVWAVGVTDGGAEPTATGLVVELPRDAGARSTVYFQHLRRVSPGAPEPADGQRFVLLQF
jgi:hypothetical protein